MFFGGIMNRKALIAVSAAFLTCFISTAWAERPTEEMPVCEFPGGAYYQSNNTLYLESFNDESAQVVITNEAASCVNSNSSSFNLVVERNTKLAANSTIVLPLNFKSKNDCVDLYEPVNFSDDEEGNWSVTAKHLKSEGNGNRPMLMITDTDREECQNIKEIEFTANNLQSTEHAVASFQLYNDHKRGNDWSFEGTYSYIRWDKDHADLGKVYGYAAKDKYKVEAGQFTKGGAGAFIPPLRAYLKYIGQTTLAKSVESIVELPETIDVTLVEEDGTTRLARWNMATGEIVKVNGWYDLKGRKLNSKPQNKGMFIGNTKVQK